MVSGAFGAADLRCHNKNEIFGKERAFLNQLSSRRAEIPVWTGLFICLKGMIGDKD